MDKPCILDDETQELVIYSEGLPDLDRFNRLTAHIEGSGGDVDIVVRSALGGDLLDGHKRACLIGQMMA